MARNIPEERRHYRGTTAQHASYTGPIGELTVDTDKKVVVVQDGVTAGGNPMVPETRTITSTSSAITVNAAASADFSADIVLALDVSALAVDLVAEDDEILTVDTEGKLNATVSIAYNTSTGKFDLVGADGATVISSVTVPSAVSMLQSVEFVTADASGNSGAFLHFVWLLDTGSTSEMYVDVSTLIDVYTAGTAIDITGNVVSVSITQLISTDADNELTTGTDGGLYYRAIYDDGTMD